MTPSTGASRLARMRLERLDPYLKSFTARVDERRDATSGTWLRLDRSAFYPTSGGQLHDTGTLEGRPVVDVVVDNGEVWHRIEDVGIEGVRAELQVGTVVTGVIDWARRFTHMQRHTGQHLLSQAFVRVGIARGAEYATRSVSMRGPACTLDLTGLPDEEALAAVETEADRAARSALPVTSFEVDDGRLGGYQLRRPAKVSGMVRLVAIGDYDLVACGGTHVRSSAEVLPLKLIDSERTKGDITRVTFMVGAEALDDHAVKHEATAKSSGILSARAPDLPQRIAALLEQLTALQRDLDIARAAEAERSAHDLLAAADRDSLPGLLLIEAVLTPERASLFEALIDRLQGEEGCVSLLATVTADARVKFAFLAGPGAEVDVRPALEAALAVVAGRGGGRRDRAHGAGERGDRTSKAFSAARTELVSSNS